MGHKKVCLNCRKAFNDNTHFEQKCSKCGRKMLLVNHKFRPPKKSDVKSWEVSTFLIENGFLYHHVYTNIEERNGLVTKENHIDYPRTMSEARRFVAEYKSQAILE